MPGRPRGAGPRPRATPREREIRAPAAHEAHGASTPEGPKRSRGQVRRSSLFSSRCIVRTQPLEARHEVLQIDLDLQTPAERRDLANALLRAAWSAGLDETRILLLDLLIEVDEAVLGGTV